MGSAEAVIEDIKREFKIVDVDNKRVLSIN